jgi:protein-tyrosine phosphatase
MIPLLSLALVALPAPSFAAQPVAAISAVDDQRVIGLQGAPNFRDLGGYRTNDGRQVRSGLVYRSNKLSALTPVDIDRVRQLHIGSLVDFRAGDERAAEPDRWQPAFVYRSPKPKIGPVTKQIMAHPEHPSGVRRGMRDLYARMPDEYRPEFAAMLHRLAASDAPLVMHCTAGKDRTGVGSAILLSLLGVPRRAVIEDYTLTQRLLPGSASAPPKAAGAAMSRIPPASMAAALEADPRYIETSLSVIDRQYGSVENYAEKGLGVSRAEIEAIRARLLTSPRS